MLDNAPDSFRPMLLTAIVTGLLASELRGLRWQDIDLKLATIAVEQRADQVGRHWLAEIKSRSADRPHRVNARRGIARMEAAMSQGRACPSVSERGGWCDPSCQLLRRLHQPTQHAAGIARPYGLHALRHAAASAWIRQGIDLKRLSAWIGNRPVQITLDTYGHLIADAAGDAAIVAAAQAELLA